MAEAAGKHQRGGHGGDAEGSAEDRRADRDRRPAVTGLKRHPHPGGRSWRAPGPGQRVGERRGPAAAPPGTFPAGRCLRGSPRRDGAGQRRQEGGKDRAQNQRQRVHGESRVRLGDPGQADRGERREQDRRRDNHPGSSQPDDRRPGDPQGEQLRAGKAKRPQGRQIGRVQVGLPGQRLPHDGKRRKPDENAKRPQRMRLQPDRPLDPGGLHLLHFGDVDPAEARGPHLPDERLPACGAVAEPDQQRGIARRRPDAVRPDERGRHVDVAKRRRGADGRELPRGGHDAHDADGGGSRAAGARIAHDEPDDAAHPQALTVGGGKVHNRLAGRTQIHHPPGDDLEPVHPETRPCGQIGDGRQFRRRRHPSGRQNGRRRRHIDTGPLPDLGHRLHPRQRPARIDLPGEPAGDQVITVLCLHEPGIGRLGAPRASRSRRSDRSRQADHNSQTQPRPPPDPQLRAKPHPDRAHNPPAFEQHPAAHCARTASGPEAGQHRHHR